MCRTLATTTYICYIYCPYLEVNIEMARNWQRFEEPVPHEKNEIYVSINYMGELAMNRHTFESMGRPSAAYLLYEKETDSIGIERTEPLMPNAFKIKPRSDCGGVYISAKPFCKKHEIKYDGTVRFLDTKIEGDTLVLNLLKTTPVIRKQSPLGRKRRS